MSQLKLGFVGWRGMVGSVLLQRIKEEGDNKNFDITFYSTSNKGAPAPKEAGSEKKLKDAFSIESLKKNDIVISSQGAEFTKKVYPELRKANWKGYWIDAASALRMKEDSVIVLDPVNLSLIKDSLQKGIKTFVGGNCTVSLMLMALAPLFHKNLISSLSSMTYQSASGAGAKQMIELVKQMSSLTKASKELLSSKESTALELEEVIDKEMKSSSFPTSNFNAPLACNLIPWIDTLMPDGKTREEWKGEVETNKILGEKEENIKVDGICVRVGVLRCHSQAFTIKLKKDIPLDEIKDILSTSHPWAKVIENTKEETIKHLTPEAVTKTLNVPIGRLRKLSFGPKYLGAFSVGDQLLWGAAEPLRRALNIVKDYKL